MSSKRGRKRNDNLPPSPARDNQRAFRARHAAHLQALEQRVSDLQEENDYLRRALDLPLADRPPLGKGPTGKDKPKTVGGSLSSDSLRMKSSSQSASFHSGRESFSNPADSPYPPLPMSAPVPVSSLQHSHSSPPSFAAHSSSLSIAHDDQRNLGYSCHPPLPLMAIQQDPSLRCPEQSALTSTQIFSVGERYPVNEFAQHTDPRGVEPHSPFSWSQS